MKVIESMAGLLPGKIIMINDHGAFVLTVIAPELQKDVSVYKLWLKDKMNNCTIYEMTQNEINFKKMIKKSSGVKDFVDAFDIKVK